jgi:hypothetical protein
MSSVYHDNTVAFGPNNLISGRTEGNLMAIAKSGTNQWMNLDFMSVGDISKVVINNRPCGVHNCDLRIIGSTLTVTVNGVTLLNHIITQTDFDKRIGDALSFGNTASVLLTTKYAPRFPILFKLIVSDGMGRDITSMGTGDYRSGINFSLVNTICSVRIVDSIPLTELDKRVVGETLQVIVGGQIIMNHTITERDFDTPDRKTITFGSASVRLTKNEHGYLNIYSILVFDGQNREISQSGLPSMSSVYNNDARYDQKNINSKQIVGEFMAHAKAGTDQWMNLDFMNVGAISKVVINNRPCGAHNCDLRIIGCTLTVTVNGRGSEKIMVRTIMAPICVTFHYC